ncbi:metal-dependent hydrolase [Sulfurovum sp. XGS-02]|uniref:metal-dependent hydrolase n=1 Tax=Sulfurovum sp. XGS-02 TaxID=2925411 RepID=UPI00205A46BE|nr:metal-dependent hydrolase [Sulfurovum sp. XGS-02]UPT77812.1 metal-dependent hydrolase [Sulfurovum sp. XGS-02]
MFIGHYATCLALKKVEKKASLGMLFLSVQLVDILFFPFVLLGIEKINIIENFTESTHFELEYMPYTHSLLASILLAGFVYIVFRMVPPRNKSVALVMGIAVLSHWFFDLIVHTPDLPLWSNTSTKLGFGLWNNAIATYTLEAVLLVGGLWLYLSATTSKSSIGKYGMGIFVILLLLVNAVNIFGPPFGNTKTSLAISALLMYFLFAGLAHWLDKKRS